MTIATGVGKQIRFKRESTWGVAPGTSGAQSIDRVTSTLDLKKAGYESASIRTDYQVADFRHGVRSIDGAINEELAPGGYADLFAAALRQEFAAGVTTGAQTTISSAASGPTFARSAGSFLTDGFKAGDVVRASGFTTTGVPMNARNFLVLSMTSSGLTGIFLDGTTPATKAAGDSVTIVVQGKKTLMPLTGHTDISYAIENFYSDIVQSELMVGCKIASVAIALPATGMATVAFTFMGKDYTTSTSAYYVSPTAFAGGGKVAAVNGAVAVAGAPATLITGLQLTIDLGLTAEPVVGSNTYPGIQRGRMRVTGQFTYLFADGTYRDLFVNETPAAISTVLTTGNTGAADFLALNLPYVKVNSGNKDDGEKANVGTATFQGLLNQAGGTGTSSDLTTMSMQDSLA